MPDTPDEARPGQPPEGPPEATTMRLSAVSGADLTEAPEGLSSSDQATVDALREGTALLVVQRGPNAGARFLLDADATTVGRHPSSDIFLDDVTVSRKHAEFRRVGGRFSVVDVGSLNGTYVNRERIDESGLRTGDEVQIGKFRLVFHLSHAAAAEDGGR